MNAENKIKIVVSDYGRLWSATILVGLLALPIVCNPAMADEPQLKIYDTEETLRINVRGTYTYNEDELYLYLLIENELTDDWGGLLSFRSEWFGSNLDHPSHFTIDGFINHVGNRPSGHNHPLLSNDRVDFSFVQYMEFADDEFFYAVPHEDHTDIYLLSTVFPSDSRANAYDYEFSLIGSHLSWDYEKFQQWRQQQTTGTQLDLFFKAVLYPDKTTSDTGDEPAGELYILIDPTENRLRGTGFFSDEQDNKFDFRLINKDDETIYITIISPTDNGSPARSFLIDGVPVQQDEMNKILEELGKGGLNVEVQPDGQPPLRGQFEIVPIEDIEENQCEKKVVVIPEVGGNKELKLESHQSTLAASFAITGGNSDIAEVVHVIGPYGFAGDFEIIGKSPGTTTYSFSWISTGGGEYCEEVEVRVGVPDWGQSHSGIELGNPFASEVTIEWEPAEGWVTEYQIFVDGELVDTIPVDSIEEPERLSFTIPGLTPGNQYKVTVRACNPNGCSLDLSDDVTTKTLIEAIKWLGYVTSIPTKIEDDAVRDNLIGLLENVKQILEDDYPLNDDEAIEHLDNYAIVAGALSLDDLVYLARDLIDGINTNLEKLVPDQDKWIREVTFLGSWPLPPTGGGNKRHPPEVLDENHVGNVTVEQVLSGKEKIEATGDWIGLGDEREPYVAKYVGIAVYNKSGEPVEADFRLRSDDGVKVLVNNEEELKDSRVQEPGKPGNTTQEFSATLKPGWNVVVVAIYNVTLGMGFRMCITDSRTGEAFNSNIVDMTPDRKATNPYPTDGSIGVELNPILRWNPGIEAVLHLLKYWTFHDPIADPSDLGDPNYLVETDNPFITLPKPDGNNLDPNKILYWQVNEKDENGNITEGEIWTFKVGDYYSIENFENWDLTGENNRPADGFSFNIVPRDDGSGGTAGEMNFNGYGTGFGIAIDNWSNGNPDDTESFFGDHNINNNSSFSFDFRGQANNYSAPINFFTTDSAGNVAGLNYSDPEATTIDQWTTWELPLQFFENQGVSLKDIQAISIGVGDVGTGSIPQSFDGSLFRTYDLSNANTGISGTIYIDNIEFHPNGIDRQQNLLSNPGFESGNKTGWTHPVCDMRVTGDQVHSGNYSAYIYNRTDTWQGPRYSVLGKMQNRKKYHVSIWVKLENAQSDNIGLTVLQTDASGTNYHYLQWATGYSSRWVQLSGTFTLNATGTVTELQIYVEGPRSGVNFYVDDASVEEQ